MTEIHLNKDEWEALSNEDQAKIQSIVDEHFPGTRILPTPDGQTVAEISERLQKG